MLNSCVPQPLPTIQDPRRTMEGALITVFDLPKFGERWVPSRKTIVALAVRSGMITAEEASTRYQMSLEELHEWTTLLERFGPKGLRLSHKQEGMSLEQAAQNMQEAQEVSTQPTNFAMGVLAVDLLTKKVEVDGALVHLS